MKTTTPKKPTKKRAIISISLFITFLLLVVSGIMIEVAEGIEWHAGFHISKATHVTAGLLFAVFSIYHIVYNWRTLKHYFTKG